MSLSDRRAVLVLLAAAPLAACGFAPVHGPGGGGAALRGAVRADDPADKNAFDFVRQIEDRLGRPETARFRLSYTLSAEAIGAGITPTGAITRNTLTGNAVFVVIEIATGDEVASGRVESFTSWSATGSTVATLAAEEDAHLRLMRMLADQVVTRLVAAGLT